MQTNHWQAILFDLDDTLHPESQFVLSGYRAVANWAEQNLGLSAGQSLAELSRLFEQGRRGNTFDLWLGSHGLAQDELVSRLVLVYREHTPAIAPFRPVPTLLALLRQRYRLGLVTDGYLAVQQRKLAALGIAAFFDAIVFSDEWGLDAWKPAVRPFQEALARLGGIPPSGAVYVADNPAKDFLGARRAGLASLQLWLPGGIYSNLCPPTPEHTPDFIVRSFDKLRHFLLDGAVQ